MRIVTEWVVTVQGFGHVSINRFKADSKEEAEKKAMEKFGIVVHSSPFSEVNVPPSLATKPQLVQRAVALGADQQWAEAVTREMLRDFIAKHDEPVPTGTDGTWCVACCVCGAVLKGAAETNRPRT